jgi:aminoglycoside 6'-N-acetyltransferase
VPDAERGDEVIRGERVVLRPATVDDTAAIVEVLTRPGVAEWWPGETPESVRERFDDPEHHPFVVELDGRAVGFIQYYEEADPDYRHAGIDVALHPDWHERGLGTDAVRTLARWLVHTRGHHRLIIDPAAHNARAIRVYEKVGFRPVGVMRAYERGAGGTWHDGLLMDLLADELS